MIAKRLFKMLVEMLVKMVGRSHLRSKPSGEYFCG